MVFCNKLQNRSPNFPDYREFNQSGDLLAQYHYSTPHYANPTYNMTPYSYGFSANGSWMPSFTANSGDAELPSFGGFACMEAYRPDNKPDAVLDYSVNANDAGQNARDMRFRLRLDNCSATQLDTVSYSPLSPQSSTAASSPPSRIIDNPTPVPIGCYSPQSTPDKPRSPKFTNTTHITSPIDDLQPYSLSNSLTSLISSEHYGQIQERPPEKVINALTLKPCGLSPRGVTNSAYFPNDPCTLGWPGEHPLQTTCQQTNYRRYPQPESMYDNQIDYAVTTVTAKPPAIPGKHTCRVAPSVGKTRTKDKYRVVYTDTQRLELEKEFHFSRYITIRRKAELAERLHLSDRQVKIWFQNRRAKERRLNRKRDDTAAAVDSNKTASVVTSPDSTRPQSPVPPTYTRETCMYAPQSFYCGTKSASGSGCLDEAHVQSIIQSLSVIADGHS